MSERSIFLAAVEHDNPAERASYLDKVCAGDQSFLGLGNPTAVKVLELTVLVHAIIDKALLVELIDEEGHVRRETPDLHGSAGAFVHRTDRAADLRGKQPLVEPP
jgi:hypothetical protein